MVQPVPWGNPCLLPPTPKKLLGVFAASPPQIFWSLGVFAPLPKIIWGFLLPSPKSFGFCPKSLGGGRCVFFGDPKMVRVSFLHLKTVELFFF